MRFGMRSELPRSVFPVPLPFVGTAPTSKEHLITALTH